MRKLCPSVTGGTARRLVPAVGRSFARFVLSVCVVGATAQVAQAQTSSASRLSIEVSGGAQAVQNVGGLGGVRLLLKPSSRMSLFADATWMQDVSTRRRGESVQTLAAYLAQTQGRQASGSIDAPAWAFTGGARIRLTQGQGMRPYVDVQGGAARVTLRPVFRLDGADVTSALAQYGVTLGEDVTGTATHPAFGGGFGVEVVRGRFTIDLGVRFLSVRAKDQPAGVSQIAIGIARQF